MNEFLWHRMFFFKSGGIWQMLQPQNTRLGTPWRLFLERVMCLRLCANKCGLRGEKETDGSWEREPEKSQKVRKKEENKKELE
jgi:hypothetical protein